MYLLHCSGWMANGTAVLTAACKYDDDPMLYSAKITPV